MIKVVQSRSSLLQSSLFRAFSNVPEGIKNASLWNPSACFINGEFVMQNHKDKFPVINPATGETVAMLPRMTASDTAQCETISWDSWQKWKKTTAKERSKIIAKMGTLMHDNIDDLARIITIEAGKPLAEARGEIIYAAGFMEWYAEEAKRMYGDIIPAPVAGRKYMTMKQSVGPAALITPWNFPSAMITRKIAPAFAAGCTVTIKPAEETPLSALAMCAIAQEAGLPAGVMNVVTVARDEVAAVGTQFCTSDYYRKISFTGSTNVGKWLLKEGAMSMKRVCLENGGNAPFIIFDDADLDVALRSLMAAKFRNAGQACIAANRVYVHDNVYDKFADMLTSKVEETLRCGNGLDEGVTMGPLINAAGVAKVDRQVQDCLKKGAVLRTGGAEHKELNSRGGCFYLPTVLTEVTEDMEPFLEETFGPVAPLSRFSSEEEVLRLANNSRSGLAGYACTSSLSRAWRVAEELEFGLVGINEGAISSEVAPFGGMKDSGLGREGGYQGIEAYLETKYVNMMVE